MNNISKDMRTKMNIKSTLLAFVIGIVSIGMATISPDENGKQKLSTISAKDKVVVQEVDPEFSGFLNQSKSIGIGKGVNSTKYSVAIGVPLNITTNYFGGNSGVLNMWDGWNYNYLGTAEALDRSVAIGDAAKALSMVSVAIGNQAHVSMMHGTNGVPWEYTTKWREIVTTTKDDITTYTTNELKKTTTYKVDSGMYERCPHPNQNWYTREKTSVKTNDATIVTYLQEQGTTYLLNPEYVDENEMPLYNRIVSSGQGDINLAWATYGVGVGSRAYVTSYGGTALGHYSRTTRPRSTSIGQSTWSESEASIALGASAQIQTNSPMGIALGVYSQIPSGMTNAIVVGAPKFDGSYTNYANVIRCNTSDNPKAMKSNSINFVYYGDGLSDFFIDNVSILDRISSEVHCVGYSSKGTTQDSAIEFINEKTGVKTNDNFMVMAAEDGFKFYTQNYLESIELQEDTQKTGDVSEFEFNGMPLPQIIQKYAPPEFTFDQNTLTNRFIERKEFDDGIEFGELEIEKLCVNGHWLSITNNTIHLDNKPYVVSSSGEAKFEAYHTTVTNQARIAEQAINKATDLAKIKVALTNFFNNIQ